MTLDFSELIQRVVDGTISRSLEFDAISGAPRSSYGPHLCHGGRYGISMGPALFVGAIRELAGVMTGVTEEEFDGSSDTSASLEMSALL